MDRKEKVLAFIRDEAYVPCTFADIAALLAVPEADYDTLSDILSSLEQSGEIVKTKKRRYVSAASAGFVKGKYRGNQRGFGFVIPDNGDDVFVPASATHGAMNGDIVLVSIISHSKSDKKREGEVVRVIEHSNSVIVGKFERERNFSFVTPDDPKITNDIFIPKSKTLNAKNGHKVVVNITKWSDGTRNPEGEVTEILGFPSQTGVDVLSVMKQYDLSEDFPKAVLEEAKSLNCDISQEEISDRIDFRNKKVFTIDGADAKDLDDAVCVEKNENGYTLSVHIADVTHYVREGSAIDKEAFKRGTSVYLADRVVPMLPKELSNGICSLNPKEDRLTLSVVMDIDFNGNVKSHAVERGIIKTVERMTYDDVTAILEGNKKLTDKYVYIKEEIFHMAELSAILKKKRVNRGSINFDFPEAKIVLDDKGKPIDVYKYRPTVAHGIIEEFMLICNETVAQQFYWLEAPFVYRVHEKPSMEKLTAFNDFLRNMSFKIKGGEDVQLREFANLLSKIDGTPMENIISRVMLRSLMKAKYSPENMGHFGLAFNYYCHFTSPIRRYPDLAIHRIIKEYLVNTPSNHRQDKLHQFAASAALHSSEMELNAQEAEREVEDLKKAQYMIGKIGERFDGVISSVASFGFFVELDNTVEGFVRVADLKDDYYIYDEKNLTLTGEHNKKVYKIGDNVRVEVSAVNTALREIDFALVDGR
ncbi:MAG: ribonuclease R [Clostridia bacterium]|nr:ribonuclease R [Clostridia bacterium]